MPYVPDHNFGSWFDMVTVGHLHPHHWVTFNAIPTCAHIIWGVCTGKLLMMDWSQKKKLSIMVVAGLSGVVAGYVLGLYIPMIERISTSSFVIFSGGWCILAMAFSYWLADIMNVKKFAKFFAIVGMNPIFIYLFAMLGGRQLLTRIAIPFTYRLFSWSNDIIINMVTIIVVSAMVWYISYFYIKRNIYQIVNKIKNKKCTLLPKNTNFSSSFHPCGMESGGWKRSSGEDKNYKHMKKLLLDSFYVRCCRVYNKLCIFNGYKQKRLNLELHPTTMGDICK